MSPMKHTAELRGEVLKDLTTGQKLIINPTEGDVKEGIWQYDPEEDGARWHYIIIDGTTYAINPAFMDWEEDILEWNENEMGR